MSVTFIAVGIDEYNASTAELVRSIEKHEPGAKLVIVDNQAPAPYPNAKRTASRLCMSAAMNFGAKGVRSDWLVFANNDLTCTAPYIAMIEALPKDAIYGVDPIDWWGRHWLDGWIMAIPRAIWREIGEFDEAFTYAGFEDADYCFRVERAGYGVKLAPLPFIHRELHSRFTMPSYMAQREANIAYLCEKWNISR